MSRENLNSLFGEFERYAADIAIVHRRGYRREAWTYRQLADFAVACALGLKARGIRTGDRVLLWGPNSAEWMAAFWGCTLRGAVAVPMDDTATSDFAARVAADAGVKLIFASRAKPALDPAIPLVVLEDFRDTLKGSHVPITQHVPDGTRQPPYQTLADEPLTRKHIAQILFTSGTTAEPRGVVLTHGNFLANLEPLEHGIDPYRKYERWFHPLRFVTLVPLSHVFGHFMALFVPPLLGATIVFEHSANPAEIIRTTKRERATALIAVPRMLDLLRAGIDRGFELRGRDKWFARTFDEAMGKKFLRRAWCFRGVHRSFGWKFWAFISGGAALSGATEEFFKRMGYAVVQGYGMTETASLISLNHPFRATEGSIGKILPGREFRLAEDGEILVRGENVSPGYWEKGSLRQGVPGETLQQGASGELSRQMLGEETPRQGAAENHGWLRTGDLGELDAEGNLRFRGRKKNVIVTPSGLNVFPEDLETAIRKQPRVRDCVVVALERAGNAEPCAVLLVDDAAKDTAAAAIKKANALLAEFQRIAQWILWPEPDFPRTATGKPRLNFIAARATGLLGGAAIPQAKGKMLDDFLAKFATPGSAPNHLERELNLTSLDRVELMGALEQRFQVELNESAFASAKTLSDVERLLRQPSAKRREYVYPGWAQRALVRWFRLAIYYALVWPATQILAHPKIIGRENLRGVRGPVLVVSNHVTRRADIGLILAALPLRFRHCLATAMGGESLEKMRRPPREWFFVKRWAYHLGYWLVTALFNVFPLPQFSGFRESFRFAGESVDRGYSLLVFPEGEVNNSEDGRMAAFRSGIGLLQENLRLPIVPMRLDGVWQMKRERRRLARFGEVIIRIGAPITFPPGTPPDEVARQLEAAVRSL
jgi:long-chain acyl-CoA synthetase